MNELANSAQCDALTNRADAQRFIGALYEPDDLVEIRVLGGVNTQRWCRARELTEARINKIAQEFAGSNIYVGANSRSRNGGTAQDVALARNLFVDFDEIDSTEACRRIEEENLPNPTLIAQSGHGVHMYWRLDEPMQDLAEWNRRQKALIAKLGSDPAIHDPPRIMRWIGFPNLKREPVATSILQRRDGRYGLSEFPRGENVNSPSVLAPAASSVDLSKAVVAMLSLNCTDHNDGSKRLFIYACCAVKFDLNDDEAIRAIKSCAQIRPFPVPYDSAAILRRIRDAEKVNERGTALESNGCDSALLRERSAGIESLTPIAMSELADAPDIDWIWRGYLAVGMISILIGLWKVGKTTLVAHLLKILEKGGSLIGEIRPAKVLIISEENQPIWKKRREEYQLPDGIKLLCRPFVSRPGFSQWYRFIGRLAELVSEDGIQVIVFDPISSFWPVENENDASQVQSALLPLYRLTDKGAAVLLLHHPRKSDGAEGRAARGSGAIPGFVDVILELRRYSTGAINDSRRTLSAFSRLSETPSEIILELTEDGYEVIGTGTEANAQDRMAIYPSILAHSDGAITAEQVQDGWPKDVSKCPGIKQIRANLEEGVRLGHWYGQGTGTRGSPRRYSLDEIPAPPSS